MSKFVVDYKCNPHQKEYQDDVTSKLLHLSSGYGGGKSFALVMKSFQLSAINKDIPGGCVVPSIADYKKDLLPLYEEILESRNIKYRYHKTDKWFRFPWSRGKMYVATAEKRITGNNWGWAVMNELTLMKHSSYKETMGRVRIKNAPCPQIASSGTPEGTGHWAYDVFVDAPSKGTRIVYGDTRDNIENLGDDYIATLEANYDDIMLDAYLRGLFVNMIGGRFYYAYDSKKHDNPNLEQIPGAEVYVLLDYNVSPMVATLCNVVRLTGQGGRPLVMPNGATIRRVKCFDQIVIDDGADVHRMDRAMRERGLEPDTTTIYPDPAGKARTTATEGARGNNEVLKSLGWHKIKVKSSAPRFHTRQLAVNNLLSKGWFELNPKTCKALKKDLEAVSQDKATLEKIKSNPLLTHASDGLDYFVDIEFPLSGHKPGVESVKFR